MTRPSFASGDAHSSLITRHREASLWDLSRIMNLRFDKVIRSVGFGFRKVYSLVLSDEGLYLVRTGSVRTLKYYRMDANRQIVVLNENDRGVKEIQKNEGRIDSTPLDDLVKESDSFVVRLEAIEEVKIKAGRSPEMLIEVTGSDHYLVFPYASLEEVETLQRALNKWSVKK
jgi:hypothetical protein